MCPIHLLHRTTSRLLHGLDLSGSWFGGQGGEVVLALWQLCSQKPESFRIPLLINVWVQNQDQL